VVPLAGLFDKDAERARLSKLIQSAEAEVARHQGQLNNPQFVAKARPDVVAAVEGQHASATEKLEGLRASLVDLG
jgi:valyl-tRNA synthetase